MDEAKTETKDFNETTQTKTLETQNDSSIDGNISEPNKVTDSTNQTTLPPGILKKPNSEKKDFNETTETEVTVAFEMQNNSSIDGNISESNKVTDSTHQTTPPTGILKNPNSDTNMEGNHAENESEARDTDDEEEEEMHKTKGIPPWKLFRFADWLDVVMLILGIITTCIGSAGIPAHLYLFGETINQFLYYGLAIDFSSTSQISSNISCSPTLFAQNPQLLTLTSGTNDSEAYFCNATEDPSAERIISNVLLYVCDPRPTLQREVGMISIYYVIMGTGVMIAVFFSTLFWNVSAYRQTRRIRQAFYQAVLRQDIGWFDVNDATELTTRLIDDVEKIQAGIGDKMAVFIQNISYSIGCFIVAFTISWKMALVVACMFPILIALVFISIAIISSFAGKQQAALASAGAFAEEKLSLIRTVVAFGGEKTEGERYGEKLKKAMVSGIKTSFFTSLFVGGTYFIFFSSFALGFWYGSTLIIACELSAGDVVIVFFSVFYASTYLADSLPDIETIAVAFGSAAAVFEIIDIEPVIDSLSDKGEAVENLEGNITFSDVIFHYPARPDVPILRGLDLEVKKGQTIALVGPSGSGKSTVVQLIQRFYNPIAGQVTIDGKEIQDLNLRTLRKNVGVVSQDPVLFNTTILENIRFGRQDATLNDVEMAARNANAHDFIIQLPEGYNTAVGERGTQLSGGQKQRIAIARALVRNPKILLLDEATSALDNKSEKVVQEALDKASEGRTTIIIAHRLSTIQTADIIVAIDEGRVVESGTHAELIGKEGLYHELLTAQKFDEEKPKDMPLARFKAAVRKAIIVNRVVSFGKHNYAQMVSVISKASSSGEPSSPSRRSIVRRSTRKGRASRKFSTVALFSDHLRKVGIGDISAVTSCEHFLEDTVYHDPYDEFKEEYGMEEPEDEEAVDDNSAISGDVQPSRRSIKYRHMSEKEKELPQLSFWELLKLNKPDWYFVVIGITMSALIAAIYPLLSIAFSEVLRIFGLADPAAIERETLKVIGGFVGLAVAIGATYFISSFFLTIAGERLTKRLRLESFKAMLRQEISWFDQKVNSTGALVARLASDASAVKGATGIRLGSIAEVVFGLIPAVIISFEASWELSFVMLLGVPAVALFNVFQIKLLRGRSHKNKKRLEESGQLAVESINNMRTVASLGLERTLCDKYNNLLKGPFRNGIKSVFSQALLLAVSQSIILFLFAAGYSLGAFLVVEGRNTYDDIFRVYAVVVFTAHTISRASNFAGDAAKAQTTAARIISLLNRTPLIDVTSEKGTKLEAISDNTEVVAKSLHFNYPLRPNVKVLQGFDVTVKHGQTLALVGPSGCGKSTIVSLLERFYDPLSGSIAIQNTDLRELNLGWLREQIGIVLQEPLLFDCSIAENIRYGALFKDVSDAEVINAAKSANIHEFIESLPKGYETNVGSKGTQLSGGQKQRISIARALIRNPKILLLDEATSALDTESEKVVQEALDKARKGRTSIVVAHRLSTIYNSDMIAVIDNGQIIESGTHSKLMSLKGAYYDLNTVNN